MNTRTLGRLAAVVGAVTSVMAGWAAAQETNRHGVPVGMVRIHGAGGPLNYAVGFAKSAVPPASLMSPVPGGSEPAEALWAGEGAGVSMEINWGLLLGMETVSAQPGAASVGVAAADPWNGILAQPLRASLPLPDGQVRELVFVRKQQHGPDRVTWLGQIAGVPASDFILSRVGDAVLLWVRDYDRKEHYTVRFAPALGERPARHIMTTPREGGPPEECGTCRGDVGAPPAPGTAAPGTGTGSATPPTGTGTPPGGGTTEGEGEGILPESGGGGGSGGGYGILNASDPTDFTSVMFIASNEAMAVLGSRNALQTQSLNMATDFANALTNSNIGGWMQVVAVELIPGGYSQAASGGTDLSNLRDGVGTLASVQSTRQMVRADHVVLLRSVRWDNIIGLAYRPIATDRLVPENGLSVVSLDSSNVGGTFSHEIGHNFGACHDLAQGACTAITSSPHGKRWSCNRVVCTDHWHTTMAYGAGGGCSPSTRVPFFSNPALTFNTGFGCSNFVLGDSVSNVSNMIQTTRPAVSQYMLGASRRWVAAGQPAVGTQGSWFSPFGLVRTGVQQVVGGTAQGEVLVGGGVYNETTANGGPVLLSNPCVIKNVVGPTQSSGTSVLR
jgi:hypothetical protein